MAPTSPLRQIARMLLCCVLALPVSAIARAPAVAAERVQQHVAAIDSRSKAASPHRERALQGFAAEGTRVVAWGARGTIDKVSVEGLGERGRVLLDFYWQRGLLIAAHARRVDYGAHILELPKDKPAPMTVVEEEWLEFAGDRLLRRREGDRDMPVSDAASRKRAAEVKAEARSFRRLMQLPDPAGAAAGSCLWSCASERRGECMRYTCK